MSAPSSPTKRSAEPEIDSPSKIQKTEEEEAPSFKDELDKLGITCGACIEWYTSVAQPPIGGHTLKAGCRSKDNMTVEAMEDVVDPALRNAEGIVEEKEEDHSVTPACSPVASETTQVIEASHSPETYAPAEEVDN